MLLPITESDLQPYGRRRPGVFSYIAYNATLEEKLYRIFDRPQLALKVFSALDGKWGEENTLSDCTMVQNLYAKHGLAPRVYGVHFVANKFVQVTDYVAGRSGVRPPSEALEEVQALYPVKWRWDMNKKNVIGGKLVDFQSAYLDKTKYKAWINDRVLKYCAWGSSDKPYQRWEGRGQRDFSLRWLRLNLKAEDFTGKTVLDVGGNLGELGQYTETHGAARVVIVDMPEVAETAWHVANLRQMWNSDFVGAVLPEQEDHIAGQFDVVFCLSAMQTKPFPWVADKVKPGGVFFFEGHVPSHEETYRPELESYFDKVEYLGVSRDHGPRPVFRCVK